MKAITECPQSFIVTQFTGILIKLGMKGTIFATLSKVFSPALEINLIPKTLFISANVLPGMDIKAFSIACDPT
ncbi:MAG: hypothetical protein V7K86_19905 [Nostoc sp.]|uniref:hypothetical protein n=1 Tax=Nostoc sp. TaxID=1180 RepID=UPI002FF88AA9